MSTNPYDPVTTTDTTTLGDDDWGLSLPGVRYKNYYGDSKFKTFCQKIQERPKVTALICLALLGLVVFIVVVAVSSRSEEHEKIHPSGQERNWTFRAEGLNFYPVPEDKTIVISFNVNDMGNHDPVQNMLDNLTAPYIGVDQFNEEIYHDCTHDDHPYNKTCRFGKFNFGPDCKTQHDYGYRHGMPCIFIQLDLPDNVMIEPIKPNSPLWSAAKYVVADHNDNFSVPLECQGKNKIDRDNIKDTHLKLDPIEYHPVNGFPAYFYRKRDLTLPFLKPAMMVRLTSLKDEQLVHFTCTAWGQLFYYNNTMVDHGLLVTEFAVYMKHR